MGGYVANRAWFEARSATDKLHRLYRLVERVISNYSKVQFSKIGDLNVRTFPLL